MFEIKDLFYAPVRCMAMKTHAPGRFSSRSFLYKDIENLGKGMDLSGAHVQSLFHPANGICTQGAGYTLNVEHFLYITYLKHTRNHRRGQKKSPIHFCRTDCYKYNLLDLSIIVSPMGGIHWLTKTSLQY